MPIEKIDFNRTGTAEVDKVAESESHLFSAAGVSSQLFSNDKASSSSLLLSIKADQAITFGIVKSIESALNRILQSQNFGKNFRLTFLDCSPYNRDELADMYQKSITFGFPCISLYAACLGLNPSEVDSMNMLENDILKLNERFKPLKSSSTLSGDDVGKPKQKTLDDSGEQTRESDQNDNR
jgi:hypothetical protein